MNRFRTQDTIVACASGASKSALAVIRVSGPSALDVVARYFSQPEKLHQAEARFLLHGFFLNQTNAVIDEVLVVKFLRPHSYTGDDVIEISCHGNPFIVDEIIKVCVQTGCRLAEPGEFTQRAFLNGKIDLVQAEAVADMIAASTQQSQAQAIAQLHGRLSRQFQSIRQNLVEKLSLLELELDFHEDEEFVDRPQFMEQLLTLQQTVAHLIQSYQYGKVIREGVHVVIVGKPNVGKSSLLNFLLKSDRAIVSEMPGTTRDTLEESLNLEGYLFKISDTAGLRETNDAVEREGVTRSLTSMQKAQLLLIVVDGNQRLTSEDHAILQQCRLSNKNAILVLNKTDLGDAENAVAWPLTCLSISCKTGAGVDALKAAMIEQVFKKSTPAQEAFIDKDRQWASLINAQEHLDQALLSLQKKLSAEFIAVDLRMALDAIGQITGEVTSEDILNNIFAKFCIGK